MGATSASHEQAGRFRTAEREAGVRAKTAGSLARYERSRGSLAGGVSSGVRRSARPYPLFFSHGQGPRIVDVDGNTYLDYTLAWGPLILGHSRPEVVDAVQRQAARGLTFGAQHELEYEVAERLASAIPCADLVAFANSGTEIVQVALRLARAVTGRSKYLKFEGHYHGWHDSVLMSYHPTREQIGAARTGAIPVSAGQTPAEHAVIAQWNDPESVRRAFDRCGTQISAVICEPLLANSGSVPPTPRFLEFLREITRANGTLLIFDEVITGFRLAYGGAQEFYSVTPDLATYAKAAGAGTALSVLAGTREHMRQIADGTVVHAGALNGNPISLAAARAALDVMAAEGPAGYAALRRRGDRLRAGLEKILRDKGVRVAACGEGTVFSLHLNAAAPSNYRDTLSDDTDAYSDFVLALLDEGVMALPDGRWYISFAHTDADVDRTLEAAERAAS